MRGQIAIADRMRFPTDKNIRAVYLVMLVLGLAYGMSVGVLPIHLDRTLQFSKIEIGQLAAFFAGGLIVSSMPTGSLVARFGAKRVLTFALAGYGVSLIAMSFARTFPEVAAVRAVDGIASVSVWVAAETLLLERGEAAEKAVVMSFYALALALGYVFGPLNAYLVSRFFPAAAAFPISAALSFLAAGLAATKLDDLEEGPNAKTSHEKEIALLVTNEPARGYFAIFRRIKTSAIATLTYGAFQSSVVLFLPIFLERERSIAIEHTMYVPAFFAAGMLLFSNYASSLGDKYGHLRLMILFAIIGCVMIGLFPFIRWFPLMCFDVFIAGAALASLSPLALALQGLVVNEHELGRANAIYNALYATGILLGPVVASQIFEHFRGTAMLLSLSAIWAFYAVFAWLNSADDPRYRSVTP